MLMADNNFLEKYRDVRWQKLRLEILERDQWKCVICGSKDSHLNVHHPVYHPYAEGPWDYDHEQLITLCRRCHEDEHLYLPETKANVLLAIVSLGFQTHREMYCFIDCLSVLTKEQLLKNFINASEEFKNGTNQND